MSTDTKRRTHSAASADSTTPDNAPSDNNSSPDCAAGVSSEVLARDLERVCVDLGRCDVSGLDDNGLRTITTTARKVERATAALIIRLGQHANQLANNGQAAPAAETLGRNGQVSASRARKEAARTKVAERIPELGKALNNGQTSSEHLDAIARALKNLNKDQQQAFLDQADQLTTQAERLPVDTFNAHIRKLAQQTKTDGGLATLQQQRDASHLKLWQDKHGMGHLHGTLDPERYAIIENAIRQETASQAKHTGTTLGPNLQATALVELISHGNGRNGRPHLTLIIDAETAQSGPHPNTICETDNGTPLPHQTAARHACDAIIRTVRLDHNRVPIDVGRRYRTATEAQWTALKAIYKTCAWHNCDRPITWCQAHHIHTWETGGQTNLNNLIPLCNTHHHNIHEDGWTITLHPDRALTITQPNRKHWATTHPNRQTTTKQNPTSPTDQQTQHHEHRKRRTTNNQ